LLLKLAGGKHSRYIRGMPVTEKKVFQHRLQVCATDRAYRIDDLGSAGVNVTDLSFPDGSPPSPEIVDKWLNLVKTEFSADPDTCIGVHCVTGLGRAPVLVGVALIELGMKYEDAVDLIRRKRRGAINSRQLEYLAKYKRRKYFIKNQVPML
jgi:protein tyrosine phosphatase type IVA